VEAGGGSPSSASGRSGEHEVNETQAHGPFAAEPPADAGGAGALSDPSWPDDPRSPSATASGWLGVVGLITTLFLPWGAVLSVTALVLGIAARPGDSYGRVNRIVGLVTAIAGLVFAILWIIGATRQSAITAG
jgi:hypothetical protein